MLRPAVDVASGKLTFGIADTDNAIEEIRDGQPIEIVYRPAANCERKAAAAAVSAAERHACGLLVDLLRCTGADYLTTVTFSLPFPKSWPLMSNRRLEEPPPPTERRRNRYSPPVSPRSAPTSGSSTPAANASGGRYAWLKTDPFNNPAAPLGPFKMAEYGQQELQEAKHEDELFDQAHVAALHAKDNSDAYVLLTVMFASVLFFGGIAATLDTRRMRVIILGVALALFVSTLVFLATMPICKE